MDEFLINPTTITMEDQHDGSRASTLTVSSQDVVSTRRSLELLTAHKTVKRQPLRSRTSFRDPLAEQLYWRGYCSDEEAVSPTDSDSMSISSASSGEIVQAVPARLSLVLPQDIAKSFRDIDRQLHRAHAVVLRPIGKANSPTSPRIIDIPPSPRLQRQSPTSPFRPPVSRLQRSDLVIKDYGRDVSADSTPRTSSEKSAVSIPSTPPTSMDERLPSPRHVLRKKPTMASMRAPRASMPAPPTSTTSETMLEFLKRSNDPYPLTEQIRDHIVAPMTPTRRKLRKFSSSFSIGRFSGNGKRKDSADSSADESCDVRAPIASATRPKPAVYIPTRTNSSAIPKMVARGANERAPVLVLPPCPRGSEEEQGQARPKTAGGRSALQAYAPTGAPRKLHRRQRSASADDVSLVE